MRKGELSDVAAITSRSLEKAEGGANGRIEVEIPVNIRADTPTRIYIDDGKDLYGANIESVEIPADQ